MGLGGARSGWFAKRTDTHDPSMPFDGLSRLAAQVGLVVTYLASGV